MLALALALTLVPPVPGAPLRPFAYAGDPFARGHHRGIDLAAARGEPVRAACSGRVAFAGPAGANGGAVTIRCGAWSVTHLPLRALAVRAGRRIPAGATLGAAAASRRHAGLHLGVRRTADPRGYVDPEPLLHAPRGPAPPAGPRTVSPRADPPPHPAPSRPARPAAPAGSSPLAPWPAWAGLALLLAGTVGAGTAGVRRTRRAAPTGAAAAPVR